MGVDYWSGLLDWIRSTMAATGKLSKGDLDLVYLTDDADDAVRHIVEVDAALTDH
jgi:predicted Rossmann-fold nucleotide-binding protein